MYLFICCCCCCCCCYTAFSPRTAQQRNQKGPTKGHTRQVTQNDYQTMQCTDNNHFPTCLLCCIQVLEQFSHQQGLAVPKLGHPQCFCREGLLTLTSLGGAMVGSGGSSNACDNACWSLIHAAAKPVHRISASSSTSWPVASLPAGTMDGVCGV